MDPSFRAMTFMLDIVQPNPYQTREREDPAHVARVAESILADGLLQVPIGRQVPGKGTELAFGHSRLAAYKLLDRLAQGDSGGLDLGEFPGLAGLLARAVANELNLPERGRWANFPVNIRLLTNEEMFRLAVSENLARKDLTPIEEAKAMLRYRAEFGKKSEEIGELFGIGGEAVRNKIRLLDLPEEVLQALGEGKISEGSGRELLALFGLPEELRKRAEGQWHPQYKPSLIVREALNGALAAWVHDQVEDLVNQFAYDLSSAPWKHDELILAVDSGAPKDLPACKGCPSRLARGKKSVCLDSGCFNQKERAWRWRYARWAAQATGWPVLELEWDGNQNGAEHTSFWGHGEVMDRTLEAALAAKCPNLRVEYAENNWGSGGLKEQGYPKATLICIKRRGFCTCMQAVRAGVELKSTPGVSMETLEIGGETPIEISPAAAPAPAITMEELNEVAWEARRQKKANLGECRNLLDRAAWAIGEGLYNGKPGVWKMILDHYSWTWKDKELSDQDVRFEIGKLLAASIYNAEQWGEPDPARALALYNQALIKAGLASMTFKIVTTNVTKDENTA